MTETRINGQTEGEEQRGLDSENDMTKKHLSIGGESFSFLKRRDYAPISIFKGENSFLRIGPKDLVAAEIARQKHLLSLGFPLPMILSEGETEGHYFYTEETLGDKNLAESFIEDCQRNGNISDENYRNFLEVSIKFATAQLNTRKETNDERDFYSGVNMPSILEELPGIKQDLIQIFEIAKQRTISLPKVLTHGDFNPRNLFRKGVIDIENLYSAPAGYDLVSNIYHVHNFPKEGDFEMTSKYEFSGDQIFHYFDRMDKIFKQMELPKLSDFVEDFIICRSIWSAAKMQRFPKIQKWRFDRLSRMTEAYLSEKPIIDIFLKNT